MDRSATIFPKTFKCLVCLLKIPKNLKYLMVILVTSGFLHMIFLVSIQLYQESLHPKVWSEDNINIDMLSLTEGFEKDLFFQ